MEKRGATSWKSEAKGKDAEVQSAPMAGFEPLRMWRCTYRFNCSAAYFAKSQFDYASRHEWDPAVQYGGIVQTLSPPTTEGPYGAVREIVYFRAHPLLGGIVSSRDFLAAREVWEEADGAINLVAVNCPAVVKDEVSGATRGQVIFSFTRAVPCPADTNGDEWCDAEMISVLEPGGGLPKWAINKTMSKVFMDLKRDLDKVLPKVDKAMRNRPRYFNPDGTSIGSTPLLDPGA